MGGYRDEYNGILNKCEYYDINKDKWTIFRKLNQKKYDSSASILDNRFIYLFGGFCGKDIDVIE